IGGRVMQAKTQDRYDLFLHFARNVFGTFTFLGLTDQVTDGIFQWEDGEVINPTWKNTIYMY
ncbi:C-type lectin domain family 4 member E-like isoform X2, partial [Biomphalaria glabrata]